MMDERILVLDRGFDAGIAALMQNANKGGMDPAALMAMMNQNGGMNGGGGSWIWMILLFVLFGFGGGSGFGGKNPANLASELNTDANTAMLMQAINGNKDAIGTLATTLNCDINAINSALCSINGGIDKLSGTVKLTGCEVINAVNSGNAGLASQLAQCCCEVRTAIERQGYENQLATVNQTAALQLNAQLHFNIISAKIDAQTTIINDKFCQLEMREMQNKLDTLRHENTGLILAASQQAQTANLVGQLRPCPSPAYIVPNPFCCPPVPVAPAA